MAGTFYLLWKIQTVLLAPRHCLCWSNTEAWEHSCSLVGTWENVPPNVLENNTKLPSEFKHFLPPEFLLAEEMPQTPPTKPPSFSNMDVFICGLPVLQNTVQLSMTGVKSILEAERKKRFPGFIVFTEVFGRQIKEYPVQTKYVRFVAFFNIILKLKSNRNSAADSSPTALASASYSQKKLRSIAEKISQFWRIKLEIRNDKSDNVTVFVS